MKICSGGSVCLFRTSVLQSLFPRDTLPISALHVFLVAII